MWAKQRQSGFTIVELLIVIVVIAILAAITIVAYNGIQQRARASSASGALNQASKKLAIYQVDNGNYPSSLSAAGVSNTGDVDYQYKLTSSGYCVTATSGNVSYKITETGSPSSGGCAGHGQGGVAAVTNLAPNPSGELNGGWLTNNSIYPVSWSTTMKRSGLRSLSASNTNGVATMLSVYAPGASDGLGFSTSGGTTFTASVYFRAEVPNRAFIRPGYRLNGTYTGIAASPYVTGSTTNWTRISHTFTVPAGADLLRLAIDVEGLSAVPAGTKAWIDDVMTTTGSTVYEYADGSSPNWDWNGTANSSTSTGPPL